MKLNQLARCLVVVGLGAHAAAWSQEVQKIERVEITGSSIKRIQDEGALPVQTISRKDLDRQGIVSAEQLIATLTSNGNGLDNLASNADVVSGQSRGNNGATSANLRLQGANATLILLNGRRIAAHGLNGGVVDLNQIPMAAIERVEVLKDGASSTYGTDAVGGVINFILRKDYQGLQASAFTDVTEHGGGNIYRASVTGGAGNLDKDGFNVMATLSLTDNKRLNGSQRDFVNSFQPDRGLSPDTRGTPFATVFFSPTITAPTYNGATITSANILDLPGGAGCASQPNMAPYAEKLWNSAAASPANQFGCAWDSGKAAVIQQPVKNTNLVSRGMLKLGEHVLTGEVLLGKSESQKIFSGNQISSGSATATITLPNGSVVPSPFRSLAYPSTGAGYQRVWNALVGTFPSLASQAGKPLAFRWRCMECGSREFETTTDTGRYLLSMDGPLPFLKDWDYKVGASQAFSKSNSVLGSGYQNWVGLANLINTGVLNPFLLAGESQTPAALAALDAISAAGTKLYGGKYTTDEYDATASGPLFKLPAGDVMAAVGVDYRIEKYRFDGNNTVNTNDINTWIFNAPFDNVNALSGVKRKVGAIFGETIIPVFKNLDLNLSVRYDKYTGFGSTTNPKASIRYQPFDSLVFRGSYSTGFRVPTFNQLFNGVTESPYTGAGVPDPSTCPSNVVSNAPGCQAVTFNTLFGGRSDLKPEESNMSNIGFIWQPTRDYSMSVDLWDIRRKGQIQSLTLTQILNNYRLFPSAFIRDANGVLQTVDTRWVNTGETQTSALEFSLRGSTAMNGGRLSAGLDGTYLLKKKSKLLNNVAFGPSEIGQFTRSSELGIRWKHSAYMTYTYGDWAWSLRQQYSSGYYGYVPPGVANGNASAPAFDPWVKPYYLHHVSVAYSGIKNLTITAGIKNIFDQDPPFANSYDTNTGSGSSWEPRVADPRGRSFTLGVDYKFF
ncbi:TonB-dependent receptor [Roseateles aquatilis]|uniref:TonB-dependent receptor n=1 Tax=Roseateles aquatilis TaxID=431061 RepID=A0A246J0X8_9BURK|nr:TonB-dependent receptor [Roseateles aquatilis]OWQ86260.1 TonB-dependent receptor [Roseateles aquatilis]